MISARCTRHLPVKLTISGCSLAPARKGGGPFAGTIRRVDLLTPVDDAAIDQARDQRRQLAGCDREHRLIQQRQSARHLAPCISARPCTCRARAIRSISSKRSPIAAASAARAVGSIPVAGVETLLRHRQEQVALLDAVALLALDEALGRGRAIPWRGRARPSAAGAGPARRRIARRAQALSPADARDRRGRAPRDSHRPGRPDRPTSPEARDPRPPARPPDRRATTSGGLWPTHAVHRTRDHASALRPRPSGSTAPGPCLSLDFPPAASLSDRSSFETMVGIRDRRALPIWP